MAVRHKTKHVDTVTVEQSQFVQLVLTSVLLAIGVGLLSERLLKLIALPDVAVMAVGLTLTVVPLLYFGSRLLKSRSTNVTLEGIIPWYEEEGGVRKIEDYDFSCSLVYFIRAAINEDQSIASHWNEGSFGIKYIESDPDIDPHQVERDSTGRLLIHATEMHVLDQLSSHLDEFYTRVASRSAEIEVIDRANLRNEVLSNPILDLRTRPIEERAGLEKGDDWVKTYPDGREVIYRRTTSSGLVYERTEFMLPKQSTIKRLRIGALQIVTPKIVFEFHVRIPGFSSDFPNEFEKLYIGVKEGVLVAFSAFLDIKIHSRINSIIMPSGWRAYEWVDSFIERLSQDFDANTFFDRIQWRVARTISIMGKNAEIGNQGTTSKVR